MGETPQRYAKVPADMSRAGWSKHADHVATVGQVTGSGASIAAALEALAANLADVAKRVHDAPMFGWDAANRSLWIAVPSAVGGGSVHYIVHFDDAGQPHVSGCTTSDSAPAREAFRHSASIERLRSPFYRES
jgi:hypothetical protein